MNGRACIDDRRGMAAAKSFPEKTNPNRPVPPGDGPWRELRGEARPFPDRCDPADPRRPLTEEQRELATRYMPLARSLARQAGCPSVGSEELEAEAYSALVDAARSFDPTRGVDFAVYARLRIRGALRDYRRFLFHAGWKGQPEAAPVFQRLGRTDDDGHGRFVGKEPAAPAGKEEELHEAIEAVISHLPSRHAMACRLIYIEGKTSEEAAAALGCSKGRVSHMHREAIGWLRRDCREALAG